MWRAEADVKGKGRCGRCDGGHCFYAHCAGSYSLQANSLPQHFLQNLNPHGQWTCFSLMVTAFLHPNHNQPRACFSEIKTSFHTVNLHHHHQPLQLINERALASPQASADEDVTQSDLQTHTHQQGAPIHSLTSLDQRQTRLESDGLEFQQHSLFARPQVFQDSNLSPALPLLPENSRVGHNFTEYSLFQQSDHEFAPLRAFPDISMASGRFHFPSRDVSTQSSECCSLSQHPLAQATLLSEEGVSSSCSLSQHCLSPGDNSKVKDTAQTSLVLPTDTRDRKKDAETLTDPGESADETFFLSKDVPAQHLLDLLQKDFGMPSSSSSAFSSASETSRKTTEEAKSSRVCKPGIEQSMERREGPTGEVSLPQKQMQPPDRDVQTQALPPEVCNITTGRRSTSPDDCSEVLQRELLSEVSKITQQRNPRPAGPFLTPYPTERREEKPSTTKTNVGSALWTGPFSAGVERGVREQDLWSSGNQTGIDGSYLGFLPQSQSTPGVLKAPPKSSMRVKLGQLSDIESSKESTRQSSIGVLSQADAASQCEEETSSAKVQSLPSLNFMEKVDAWRANQSSGKTSLFDSLALQGFSGVSPKKRAYDAVSDSLNRILSQQARSLQQPAAPSAANPNVTQNSSAPSASSSSKRGEAVGSAPSDKDNTGSTVRPSASPYGRSQSHSSINTVMSVNKDQQTEASAEESSQLQEATQPGVVAQPSPFMSLGHFSDVSLDRDSTLSSSRDSNNYEIKLGTSIGASSVVSLEVDNYAPYWTSKMSTPPPQPRPREFNIEERIPLYLRNLGIDQSPSTILTPFAPLGPIREPEFSPTDLCTVKGSTGTPTKSAQPSEGGSPQKEEFSRCSVLSVDSSMSVPFSMDSLGPSVSLPERPRRPSPLSSTDALQSERSLTASFEPEDPHPSALQIPLRDDSLSSSQNTIQSPLHTSRSVELNTEDSFVSSNALFEIRKLISQAEDVVSAGSSSASAAVPRLLSDNDIFLSLRNKSTKLQDSLFSSSSAVGDPSTGTSLLWTRSSSDSMLTSDKVRESSIGQERTASSGQPSFPTNQVPATSPHRRPEDKIVSRDTALSFIPSQSSRRAEPEGCSAAPPDNAAPPQPAVVKPSQQLPSTPAEEEAQTAPQSPAQSSSSTPIPEDQGAMSDGSSESSLAIRVAKLLQNESPSTMVSSTTSTTDQEESKAREWIKLKISGQECEPLELDKEDRRRIEEIKRELLLKNPVKSPRSTDTESSTTSSIRAPTGKHPSLQTETVTSTDDANKQPSQQGLRRDLSDPDTQLKPPPASNLEAQVREIAAREGVTLPRSNSLALKSITIATRRRSTSPSPSTSPAPPLSWTPEMLHLHELSTEAAKQSHAHVHFEEEDETMTNQNRISQSSPGLLKRQDTVGGQLEESAPSLQVLDTQKMDAKDSQQVFSREGELPIHDSSVPEASPPFEPAARTGHVSRVLLTLSPKGPDYSSATSVLPDHADALTAPPHKEFLPLRLSPSAVSSPDEGVGLSSPPEWSDSREAVRQRGPDRADTSALFRPAVHQRKMTAASAQSLKPLQEIVVGARPSTNQTPAVPVLLPYKPRGSEELFYVPQTKADLSSTDHSDTTMESTHTGSDDAVPPRFSSDVLGHKDPGLDRGVTTRHSEGIYSKRLKTATFRMREPEHRGVSKSADAAAQTSRIQTPKPSSHISVAFTRVPLSAHQEPSRRDQGTSPVQFLSHGHPETITETLDVDTDFSLRDRGFVPQTVSEQDRERMNSDPAESSSALDQLWQKFCDRWSLEESRSTSDREASLLERLERLSRLIHSTRKTETSGGRPHPGEKEGGRREDAVRRERRRDVEPRVPGQAWTQRIQAAETSPADKDQHDSITSTFSHDSTLSPTLRPADRDESDSSSMSTVDTARLTRAFGAHRVRHMKTSSGLSKLYSAINRQKDGREQRREQPHTLTPSETTGTDESTVDADSVSWSSASTLQSHHGPSKALTAKRGVKLVNKGIQAGDLELVSNATRRHTRDVGTTFPSPAESRTSRRISSSSSSLERGRVGKSSLRQRRVKKSPSKTFPQGVSWFISAEELKSEARKENRPEEEEEEEGLRTSTAWFEPLSRTKPWREPLRQRQVHQDREERQRFILQDDPDPSAKTTSSGPARVSLQEALQMHRPDFISQSRQRVQRLALQAEERRLQADFIREREDLFSRPGGPGRLPRPAGTAQLRRAVPRKEMIQRSKQIYENLPEVQRRREEERRKAEYRSYRLNAQLYNKKITSRVLGRRAAWP